MGDLLGDVHVVHLCTPIARNAGAALPGSRCWATWTGNSSSWLAIGGSTAAAVRSDPGEHGCYPGDRPVDAAPAQPVRDYAVAGGRQRRHPW